MTPAAHGARRRPVQRSMVMTAPIMIPMVMTAPITISTTVRPSDVAGRRRGVFMKRDLTVQPTCRAALRSRNAGVLPGARATTTPLPRSHSERGRILALVTRPHRPDQRRYLLTAPSRVLMLAA